MSALGSLVVSLGLGYAEFTGGLDKSEQAALAASKRIQDTMDGLKTKLATTAGAIAGGLAAAFTVSAFKSIITGSIETGGALDDLRMQTGSTVEALSALAAVGKFNNMGAEEIGGAMNKLSANLAGASEESKGTGKALEALGLDFDKFKQMRPEDQMQAVAKAMAEFEDGTGKSAVAMALYGKQGAAMLPFLGDLADVGELQAKVTTEQAAAAANLDDNLTRLSATGDAWKKELANGMIPALDVGAQAMVDVMNGTGGIRDEVRKLAADGSIKEWTTNAIKGLSYVADAGQVAWRTLQSVGKGLGGLAAALVQALQGDFRGAWNILQESGQDMVDAFDGPTIGARFRQSLDQISASAAAAGNVGEQAGKKLNFVNVLERTGKAAAEAKNPVDALMESIDKRIAVLSGELSAGEKLTEGEKMAAEVRLKLAGSTDAQIIASKGLIESRLKELLATEKQVIATREEAVMLEAAREKRVKVMEAAEQHAAQLVEQNIAMREEIEMIGLTSQQQARVLQQRNEAIILIKEATLAEMERESAIIGTANREQTALQAEIAGLRERNKLLGAKVDRTAVADETKKVEEEWKRTAESINQSLTDALLRGFESGKDFAKNMRDTIVNMFKTMVLRPVVQAVVSGAGGVAATAASASGFDGLAKGINAASSANSMYGMATGYSSGVNIAASMFGAGSAAGASAASLGYANAIGAIGGDSLGALIAANGSWGGVAAGTAAGTAATGTAAAGAGGAAAGGAGLTSALSAVPVWGWIAAAVVAVASAFGGRGKKETTDTGIAGTLGASGINVRQYADWEQDGGWFHSDRGGRNLSGISAEANAMLSTATAGITQSTRAYATALGLSADAVNGYTHAIDVSLKDLSPEQQQEAIGAALAGFADGMAGVYAGLAGLAREGEGASATLARVSVTLTSTNAWLSMLRQRTFQLGLAGGDAASKLADAMGGLENLGAAVEQYYGLYYTETEKAAYSTEQMTIALAAVGVAMPATKDAFRAVADSLDLNTTSGRAAYATLLSIAPEFSNVADQHARLAQEATRLAQETAAKLLEAFSGRQQLIPLLDATLSRFDALGARLDDAAGSVLNMGNATGWINTQLGSASSGLLFFGDQVQALGGDITGAQLASAELSGQILNLKLNAGRTVTDIAGLSAALANVNTETFLATMQGVLTRLGSMFSDVLNSISDERVAVRDAATQIINPTVMSKAAIEREIAGANIGMPSNAGIVTANARLAAADAKIAGFADLAAKQAAYGAKFDAAYLAASWSGSTNLEVWRNNKTPHILSMDIRDPSASGFTGLTGNTLTLPTAANVAAGQYGSTLNGETASLYVTNPGAIAQGQISAMSDAVNYVKNVLTPLRDSLGSMSAAQAEQNAAADAAKKATLAYVDSLQNYALDASKATSKLGKLREETVKYYESQKALADLMSQSAGTLRQTVADYRYNQLSPEEQFRSLEGQFNTAYSMALSTSGETLAGYADQMSGLLGPMLDKMSEAGYSGNASAIASYLARAEAVAGRVESQVPTNYAADSLTMLGQIDSTLAALEAGSKSAERIIADAINVGRDQTVNGLRQVVNALTGRGVAAFAAGGMHTGGLRLVGENGPELEVTGPARIYNASQTRSMLGGGGGSSAEVVAELRALRQDNANMRIELRAIVTTNAKAARSLARIEEDGVNVRNDADTPLTTVPA